MMRAGGYWWAVAKKGRPAALERMVGRSPQPPGLIGLRLLGVAGQAWAAGYVTETEVFSAAPDAG
jgi:hypothetical protein